MILKITPIITSLLIIPSLLLSEPYIGLGLTKTIVENPETTNIDVKSNAINFNIGYTFNEFFSLETRYSLGLNTNSYILGYEVDTSIDTLSVFLKPSYPVFKDFLVYGLIGYGARQVTINDTKYGTIDGISYGGGLSYKIYNNFDVFADYTTTSRIDYETSLTDTYLNHANINFGTNYRF